MKKNQPIDPDTFESAFAEFWESKECDELNWVLFDLIKAAFAAGCRAAGGGAAGVPSKGSAEPEDNSLKDGNGSFSLNRVRL